MSDRRGLKWTVNELLALQREYELLGWSVEKIAKKHKRSVNAIMFKLDDEGLADYNVLAQTHLDEQSDIIFPVEGLSVSETMSDTNNVTMNELSKRMESIEGNIADIQSMLKEFLVGHRSPVSRSSRW